MDNLLEWRDRDGSSDYIPLVDHRNSVVGAWDMMSGSLTGVADYTAQGRLTLRDALEQPICAEEGNAGTLCDAPGGMPFAFNSRWRSPRTGLVNMRARWYSPKLGQFTSHDPLGYVDTQNLYAFAAFDPINSWDPNGLEAQDQTQIDAPANVGGTGGPDGNSKQPQNDSPTVGDILKDSRSDLRKEAERLGLMEIPVDVGPTPNRAGPQGKWDSDAERIWVKDEPSATPLDNRQNFFHELFHAIQDFRARRRANSRKAVLHQYFRMMKFLGKEQIVQWKLREEYRAEVAGWRAAIQEARGELPMSDRNLNRIAMNLAAEGFDTTEWEKVYAQEYDGYKQTLISLMGPAFAAVWTNQ